MNISNRVRVIILGFVVTAIAVYFIVAQLDLELFWQAWQTANYVYIIPSMLLLLLGLITRAFRWRVLLGHQLSFQSTFNIMNVSYLINGIMPFRIGEVARVYLVARKEQAVPIPTTTSTIVVERLLDLVAVLVLVVLALMLGPVPEQIRAASTLAAVATVIGIIVLMILATQHEWALKIFRLVLQRLPYLNRYPILEEWFIQFLDGLRPIAQWRPLMWVSFWTIISWVFSVLAGYVLMFAFYDQASMPATLLFIAAASFAVALPAVPGNVGPYEASILLALTAMGYAESSVSIAFAVMVHAVGVFLYLVTGVIGLIQEGVSLAQLSQGVRQMQQTTTQTG